jgi:hypothetical protein
MANIYVGGASANDSNTGASWALAKATIAGALAIATTADTVVVDQDYVQSAATAVTLTCPTTTGGATVRIETGVITASDPPVQDFYGASITTTGASSAIAITGNVFIAGGVGLALSTSGASANINIGTPVSNDIAINGLLITFTGAGTGIRLSLGTTTSGAPGSIMIKDLTVIFGNTAQQIVLGQSRLRIDRLMNTLGSRLVTLFSMTVQRGLDAMIMGGDISRLSQTGNILVMTSGTGKLVLARMKMPSGWTGGCFSAAPTVRTARVELHDCYDDLGTRFDIEEDSFGKGVLSTAHYRTGGRDRAALLNGRTNMCSYPACPFVYELEPIWNETVGSSITVSVPVLADGAEPTDAEIAIRVSYEGGTVTSMPGEDGFWSTLFTAQELTTKYGTSSGWTTTLASPKPRKIDVPITVGSAGFIKVEVLVFVARNFAVDVPVLL